MTEVNPPKEYTMDTRIQNLAYALANSSPEVQAALVEALTEEGILDQVVDTAIRTLSPAQARRFLNE